VTTSIRRKTAVKPVSIHLRYAFAINLWLLILIYSCMVCLGFGVERALSFSVKVTMASVQQDASNKVAVGWMDFYQVQKTIIHLPHLKTMRNYCMRVGLSWSSSGSPLLLLCLDRMYNQMLSAVVLSQSTVSSSRAAKLSVPFGGWYRG